MQLRHEPPSWAARYVGIPFAWGGRDRRGVDCWGLARMVYAERLGVLLPQLAGEYSGGRDAQAIDAAVRRLRDGGNEWLPLEAQPREVGDVVLFRPCRGPWHVGLAIARGKMLHAQVGTESCIERVDGPDWSPRVHGVYRFAGPVAVAGRIGLLSGARIDATAPAGLTLEEILVSAGIEPSPALAVFLGGVAVPSDRWRHVRPKPGRLVTVAAVAAGVGGKSPLRIIATIAVMAAAIAAPYALAAMGVPGLFTSAGALTLTGSLVAAAVGLGGTLLINALLPAPSATFSNAGGADRTSPTITGARNESRPYQRVPVLYGEHRITPPYGALPYTEAAGDDQFLRLLFVSKGPLEISDLKIGETPIEQFQEVQVEVRQGFPGDAPITLYPGTVLEQPLSVLLQAADPPTVRTSDFDADQLAVDISWPAGLARLDTAGNKSNATVDVKIEYSLAGANTWASLGGSSPADKGEMDALQANAVQSHSSGSVSIPLKFGPAVGWGSRPPHIPLTKYIAVFALNFPAGMYEFGLDGADAVDILDAFGGNRLLLGWYGQHATYGGSGGPNYDAYTAIGTVTAVPPYLNLGGLYVRVECRSGAGALAAAYRAVGSSTWIPLTATHYSVYDTSTLQSHILITAARTDPIRKSMTWSVPRGQYDVRVKRVTADSSDPLVIDDTYWSALRTIRSSDPVKLPGMAKIAVRIKATDQLNGVVDEFNFMGRSILPDWDQATQTWVPRATSNPASVYRDLFQGRGARRPLADSRMDLAALQAWHEDCTDKGYAFNGILDFPGTLWQRAADVAAAGRATPGVSREGKFTIVRDRLQTVPVQHFTPRNSWGFKGRKTFPTLPHALRAQFFNANKGYTRDELVVLDDGYQIDGRDSRGNLAPALPPATEFETIELFGTTDPQLVWKHARFYLANGRLRTETFDLQADPEHLACTRGDLVLAQHDVPQWGLASGRLTGVTFEPDGRATALNLDEEVTLDPAMRYTIRIRNPEGTSLVYELAPGSGPTTVATLLTPILPTEIMPAAGDLFSFGELGRETAECLVKAIDIDEELNATLTLIAHAPQVYDADADPPSAEILASVLTTSRFQSPAVPVIADLRTADGPMLRGGDGTTRSRLTVVLARPSGTGVPTAQWEVSWRPAPPGDTLSEQEGVGPWAYLRVPVDQTEVAIEAIEPGTLYDVAVRAVAADGRYSDWTEDRITTSGKLIPPPNVSSFSVERLSDGLRRFTWTTPQPYPMDLAGVKIRYGTGGLGTGWESLAPLHEGVLSPVSPATFVTPPAGLWTFAIKTVDNSGGESLDAMLIDADLAVGSKSPAAMIDDARAQSWITGTLTGCVVNGDTELESDGSDPIVYTSPEVDLGRDVEMELVLSWLGEQSPSVLGEARYKPDGGDWTDWTSSTALVDRSVRLRYVQYRLTCSGSNNAIIRRLVLTARGEVVQQRFMALDTTAVPASHRFGTGRISIPISDNVFGFVASVQVAFAPGFGGYRFEVSNHNTAPGPTVRTYDPAGVPADAIMDVVVSGIAIAKGAGQTESTFLY